MFGSLFIIFMKKWSLHDLSTLDPWPKSWEINESKFFYSLS